MSVIPPIPFTYIASTIGDLWAMPLRTLPPMLLGNMGLFTVMIFSICSVVP